jgi:hypothetical protein
MSRGIHSLMLVLAVGATLPAQVIAAQQLPPIASGQAAATATASSTPANEAPTTKLGATPAGTSVPQQPLFNFKDSDIKFNLGVLMNTLRDSRHEGWVLAAYPDPKTSRPLIGAGFSLDLPEREHPQRDPLNPHPFVEPSSTQLWQAAGLDSAQLQSILDEFDRQMQTWQKKKYRRKIRTHELSPQLSEEEATQLLRISAIQATYNARAYCRFFDQLTASQQLALSQLVFQMGVNLEEFTQFLSAINQESAFSSLASGASIQQDQAAYWKMVQSTLIQSQWARRYSDRAISVIAMFDPAYSTDPAQAEREVRAVLHPARHRRKARVKSASAAKSSSKKSHSNSRS